MLEREHFMTSKKTLGAKRLKHSFTPKGNISVSNPPTSMFLGGGRKPEEPGGKE